MSDEQAPTFRLPCKNERESIDRTLEMTLRYNYLRDLKEANKPNLYGPGIDFYEEDRIRIGHELNW